MDWASIFQPLISDPNIDTSTDYDTCTKIQTPPGGERLYIGLILGSIQTLTSLTTED